MKIKCPKCYVRGNVKETLVGKDLQCPKCDAIFRSKGGILDTPVEELVISHAGEPAGGLEKSLIPEQDDLAIETIPAEAVTMATPEKALSGEGMFDLFDDVDEPGYKSDIVKQVESGNVQKVLHDGIAVSRNLNPVPSDTTACSSCGGIFLINSLHDTAGNLQCELCQMKVSETDNYENTEASEDGHALLRHGTDFTVRDITQEAWRKTSGAKMAVWTSVLLLALGLYSIGQQSVGTTSGMSSGTRFTTILFIMLFVGGTILLALCRARGQDIKWKSISGGLTMPKLLSMCIAVFLQIIIIAGCLLLLILPGIYLLVSYTISLPLILDKGMGPWEALETSRKIIRTKWWTVFGLYVAVAFLYLISTPLAGIGLLWTVPMSLILVGVLYARIVDTAH